MSRQVALWLDHHEAKLFHVDPESFAEEHLHTPHASVHEKHREKTHPAELAQFFRAIADGLHDAQEILVLGPGSTKLELLKWMHLHAQGLVPRVIGVETADHPRDRQIVAHARAAFGKHARMLGNAPT